MSKRPPFRQRDVTRLVRAATAAGIRVNRIEIGPDGGIAVSDAGDPAPCSLVNADTIFDAGRWGKQ